MSPDRPGPRLQLQLTRVLTLWRRLQGLAHLPAHESLASELRVSRRTVIRDLAALRGAGWPVPPPNPRFGDRDAAS